MTASKKTPKSAPETPAKNSPLAVTFGEQARRENLVPPEKGIGGRIKEARLRKDNDLTIEALSRLCKMVDPIGQGIAQPTIVRYEKGEVLPGAREIRVICNALDVSADWLLFGKERVGVIDMGMALDALSRMLTKQLTEEGAYRTRKGDMVRELELIEARKPQPRK